MPLVASVMPCANQTCSCELCTYQLLSWHAVPPGSLALPGAQKWSHCAPTACAGTLSVHGQSPTKKQHSHITCVPPWFVDLIVGNFWGKKNFRKFCGFVAIRESFLCEIWDVAFFGVAQASNLWKLSPWKSYFSPIRESFLSQVSCYKVHELVCAHVCTHVRACVHVTPCDQHSMWLINPPYKLL